MVALTHEATSLCCLRARPEDHERDIDEHDPLKRRPSREG